MRVLLLVGALGMAAGAAHAAAPATPALNPDLMTVSGRLELPRAEALAGRLRIAAVRVAPTFAKQARLKPEEAQAVVEAAAARSLRNFGYLAGEAVQDAVPVTLELLPAEASFDARGATVTSRLRIHGACLDQTGEGRFRALARERSGGARRALGVASSVAISLATGYVPPTDTFLVSQLELASADHRRRNAERPVAEGEGVAEGFGEAATLKAGAVGAVRMALVDTLRRLHEAPACPAA